MFISIIGEYSTFIDFLKNIPKEIRTLKTFVKWDPHFWNTTQYSLTYLSINILY